MIDLISTILSEDCDCPDLGQDHDHDNDDDEMEGLGEGFDELVEDPDDDALVCEAAILQIYGTGPLLEQFLEEQAPALVKKNVLSEKSIVRLDKYAKLSRAESQAVYVLAKKNNDRDYKKLVTLYKLRKVIKDRLNKKYANAARRYAKEMMKKGGKSLKPEKEL